MYFITDLSEFEFSKSLFFLFEGEREGKFFDCKYSIFIHFLSADSVDATGNQRVFVVKILREDDFDFVGLILEHKPGFGKVVVVAEL